MIIGVDEAGRGPLAGPVCAGAVVLRDSHQIAGLTDSKKLSALQRARLEREIKSDAKSFGLGWASETEIDEHNILMATFLAMSRAVRACLSQCAEPVHEILVDGHQLPARFLGAEQWPWPTRAVIKGDLTEPCISAASILAKVARDQHMRELDQLYPHYGFAQHAGYGTAAHLRALQLHGACPVHRRSFAPVASVIHTPT